VIQPAHAASGRGGPGGAVVQGAHPEQGRYRGGVDRGRDRAWATAQASSACVEGADAPVGTLKASQQLKFQIDYLESLQVRQADSRVKTACHGKRAPSRRGVTLRGADCQFATKPGRTGPSGQCAARGRAPGCAVLAIGCSYAPYPAVPRWGAGGQGLPSRPDLRLPPRARHGGVVGPVRARPAGPGGRLAGVRLHPLAVEDAVQRHERPKLDRYQDHAFLTVYAVSLDRATGRLTTSELAAFATPGR
jgi:hypothetical protein